MVPTKCGRGEEREGVGGGAGFVPPALEKQITKGGDLCVCVCVCVGMQFSVEQVPCTLSN